MNETNLFCGKLVKLTARRLEDREVMARWTEDPEYLRQADTDFARPQAPEDVLIPTVGSNSAGFLLRTLSHDKLIGFVALFNIEWNNGVAGMAIGIGEPEYRGKGYGSDALELILQYAFTELNLHRVGLDVISTNTRAIRAYEKAGFQHEGVWRESVYRDGQRADRILMGILRHEWEGRKKG